MPSILQATAHRPYALPERPWIMTQRWHDLLFAHWGMEPESVRLLLPKALRPFLDTFEGKAWVGVVPFWMSRVKFRGLPALPGLSTFAEMNVRTYVTVDGKPGVYFFSLDAENLLAVYAARIGFSLAYFYARMSVNVSDGDGVQYSSRRLEKPRPAEFAGSYAPVGVETFHASRGSIEQFLVERYCLYTANSRGEILRGDIHHLPWPLRHAEAKFEINNVAQSHGIQLPNPPPLLHFAKELDVFIWPPERVG
ncbi:MAG: hypothetical protein JWO20_1143 [Candidatus Angelobacter sp.]|nr:hypothetical protein [Candidatus Angelobacter sp.]